MIFAANILNTGESSSFYFAPTASGDPTVGGTYTLYGQALATMPVACTFDSLYVNASTVPAGLGGGGQIIITLWVNDATTALTVAVDNTSAAGTGNMTGASIATNPGDTISLLASGTAIGGGSENIATSLHCQ
jgi:hypothetical protein